MPYIQAGKYQTLVDPEDFERLRLMKWRAIGSKGYKYAYTSVDGKNVALHRMLMSAEGTNVDHINRDTLDNRRCNLRICDHAENMRNRKQPAHSKQPYKGVEACKGSWRARIRVDGQRYHLGTFETPEEAYAAYCKASPLFHGEFGCLQ